MVLNDGTLIFESGDQAKLAAAKTGSARTASSTGTVSCWPRTCSACLRARRSWLPGVRRSAAPGRRARRRGVPRHGPRVQRAARPRDGIHRAVRGVRRGPSARRPAPPLLGLPGRGPGPRRVSARRADRGRGHGRRCGRGGAPVRQIARRHRKRAAVRLVLVGGLPGTGKSTVAERLASELGAVVLSSDRVSKELAGLRPEESAGDDYRAGLYIPETTERVYGELLGRAEALLGHGQVGGPRCVLDGRRAAGTGGRARRAQPQRSGGDPLFAAGRGDRGAPQETDRIPVGCRPTSGSQRPCPRTRTPGPRHTNFPPAGRRTRRSSEPSHSSPHRRPRRARMPDDAVITELRPTRAPRASPGWQGYPSAWRGPWCRSTSWASIRPAGTSRWTGRSGKAAESRRRQSDPNLQDERFSHPLPSSGLWARTGEP
jgi:hypothetical protein